MNNCLVCLYETFESPEAQDAFVLAVVNEAGANPLRAVTVCDLHFVDMALLAERLGDVL